MSVEDVREVYLNIEGRLMQVKDIAEVGIRPRDKRGMFVNGEKQSLCMAVIKQSSARMSEMKEKVSEMLENFETEYPDIEFLQISRDEQKEAWESYIAHKNSPLTQYNSVDMELAEGWQLFYIPRFILVDKEQKIIDAYAPRPSSTEIITLLDSLSKA